MKLSKLKLEGFVIELNSDDIICRLSPKNEIESGNVSEFYDTNDDRRPASPRCGQVTCNLDEQIVANKGEGFRSDNKYFLTERSARLYLVKQEFLRKIEKIREEIYRVQLNAPKSGFDMTITKAKELYSDEHPVTTIARYHDLGKSVARTERTHDEFTSKFIERTIGEHDSYKGHENVSAMYYHIARQNEVDTNISDAILHHMNAHDSIDVSKNKSIIRSGASPQAIDYMEKFREIDSVSRVVDEDYVDMYKTYVAT